MRIKENLQIITDHKWKDFIYGYQLTTEEKKDYNWMDQEELETSNFFRYRGSVYSIQDFMRIENGPDEFNGWDGYLSDTFFSGVLIKLSEDGEQYQVALFLG
jgi:hypothetical protein